MLVLLDTGLGCLAYHDKTDKGANSPTGMSMIPLSHHVNKPPVLYSYVAKIVSEDS